MICTASNSASVQQLVHFYAHSNTTRKYKYTGQEGSALFTIRSHCCIEGYIQVQVG